MNAVTSYLKTLWSEEPVRATLYTVLSGLVAVLLVRFGVDGSVGDVIDAVIAVALGVPTAELVRSQVKPKTKR